MREFCLRKREVAAKPTFTRMDIPDWSRAVMVQGMHMRRVSHPGGSGIGPAPRVSADSGVADKGRSDDDVWRGRKLVSGATNGSAQSRRGGGGTTDDGEKIFAF